MNLFEGILVFELAILICEIGGISKSIYDVSMKIYRLTEEVKFKKFN